MSHREEEDGSSVRGQARETPAWESHVERLSGRARMPFVQLRPDAGKG
jgi:hypothetical protein